MIITKTPFRISFFGGGTDFPPYFRNHPGAVIATTIDKYCYISCRRLPQFFEHKHRIVYSKIENVTEIDEINHPSVREVLRSRGTQEGLEIHHDGDLPARSGLGSSSSFTVGLLNALSALSGSMLTKEKLACEAIHVEQNLISESVGSQDQVSAAYGGFNRIDFNRDDSFTVEPLIFPNGRKELLHSHLMLFFTGVSRFSSEVAQAQVENIKSKEVELGRMYEMVQEGINILQDSSINIEIFGRLLNDAWMLKRSLSDKVSTSYIDGLYEAAMRAGAIGGKILGAGGGGFLLLFASPEKHELIRAVLSKLIHVPFQFENAGSRVVLYEPNGF
jgi:D-glycero-alpha-D-manno-heptose-7-phosphate kinase